MWNLSKNSFLLSLGRSVFLKSECKSTNYFPNTQEFRRKSLEINSYLTVRVRNKRLSCPLSLYYTHGSAGSACAGAQAKENMMFWIRSYVRRSIDRTFASKCHTSYLKGQKLKKLPGVLKLLPLQGALLIALYPGRCPGLGASALSGRVVQNLRKFYIYNKV